MALGDTYQNNKKDYENKKAPTVYSRYAFSNIESQIDPSKLSFTFWNGFLKISIAPLKPGTEEFDYDNSGSVYLTYLKAKLLADEITLFLQNPDTYSNVGVPSGSGLISITNGKDVAGKFAPSLVIRQIDEGGKVISTYLYEFKTQYHYSIRNYVEGSSEFDKIYNDMLEIEALRSLLLQYYESMSGAMAYSIIDQGRFDTSRINTKLDSIAEKLGIQYGGGKKSYDRKPSVFDKAEGRSYTAMDLDDIEEQM